MTNGVVTMTCPAMIVASDGSIANVFIAATREIPMNSGGSITGSRDPLSTHAEKREGLRTNPNAAVVPTRPATIAVDRAATALVRNPERNASSRKIRRNHRSERPWSGQFRFAPPLNANATTTTSGR